MAFDSGNIQPVGIQRVAPRLRPSTVAPASLRVAIVHYWLVHMRGGEKVLEALCEMFPQADIFTHVYDPDKVSETIRKHRVQTTFIARLPGARKHYAKYLPLMPLALEQLDLSDYDLVISSESGPAKGVITRPDSHHICYCHSPMRYAWDQYHAYRRDAGFVERMAMPLVMHGLRQWDVTSAARVDRFVANSSFVASRIQKYYRRDADVIAPPVDVDAFETSPTQSENYLFVSELVPYKRADLAVAAFTKMNKKLVVIGKGADRARLERMAGPTIEFRGHVSHDVLREEYARCKALIFPAEEDFGIVPVETMAAGRPVIAYGRGGIRDSVIDGKTGVFFDAQTVDSLIDAVQRFESAFDAFSSETIAEHARQFSVDAFKSRFFGYLEACGVLPVAPVRIEPMGRDAGVA